MRIITLILLVLAMTVNLSGADLTGVSYAGIKIGVGHTNQDTPDEQYFDYNISADQNGFHTEVFFNWHFLNVIALDVGLSVINRGEFRWLVEGVGNFFGTINLYPIDAGVKIKPLASQLSDNYQPWIAGGGSLVVGRGVIEGGSIDPYFYGYLDPDSESATTLGWWIGAGFDSFVSTTIGLTGSVKYHKMDFDKAIGGYLDHSGYQIAFGIAYIIRTNNE